MRRIRPIDYRVPPSRESYNEIVFPPARESYNEIAKRCEAVKKKILMSPASILPITAPEGAPVTPPYTASATLLQMLSQQLIAVSIPVVFDLLSNKLDMPFPNSLHLYELYAALVIFVLFTAILLFSILSASAAAAAASAERAPHWLVRWVHATACSSLFIIFMLRFYIQTPIESFVRSSLVFLGIAIVLLGAPLLTVKHPSVFNVCFQSFRSKVMYFAGS